MKRQIKQQAKWIVIMAMVAMLALSGCGASASNGIFDSIRELFAEESGLKNEVPTISLYPADANLSSGTVDGFLGEYFESLGFAVEVWDYSDDKTSAILASGDLPDIMYVPVAYLDDMIEKGMLLNLEDYMDQMPHVQSEDLSTSLNYVREYRSGGTGELYCLPVSVGTSSPEGILFDSTDRNAVKLLWSVYEEIGAPEITDFYSLIDVMEEMLEERPVDEDGNSYYGIVLNNGFDTTYWQCMLLWYRWQGYSETELPYLLELDMVNCTITSILNENSMYYQGLKWYNEAYRRGVLDPDSISSDRATQKVKVDRNRTMVPGGGIPGWATRYLQYLIPGTSIYYNNSAPYGDSTVVIAINANTENVDVCIAFLDMLANPDALMLVRSGPDGEIWETDEEGNAVFTERFAEYVRENGSYSGYEWESGEKYSLWNTAFIVRNGATTTYGDGNGGYRSPNYVEWTDYQETTAVSDDFVAWRETTGYASWDEWLEAEDALVTENEYSYTSTFESTPNSAMQKTIDAIKDVVVNASWQMVYAQTDEEFESVWEQMVEDCESLGCDEIMEWRLEDIANAQAIVASLEG
ncbi:MAG: extracellular solute-binding protein [Lachnospiraceae bacterium]|nr:extracellular solute-binding protein [Lachnospiraceae bacterium]